MAWIIVYNQYNERVAVNTENIFAIHEELIDKESETFVVNILSSGNSEYNIITSTNETFDSVLKRIERVYPFCRDAIGTNGDKEQNERDDLITLEDAIQAKPEMLNENIVRDTEEQTRYDRAYSKGWNACNSIFIQNLKNVCAEMKKEETCDVNVKDCSTCKYGMYNDHHGLNFCYNDKGCSNWELWEAKE